MISAGFFFIYPRRKLLQVYEKLTCPYLNTAHPADNCCSTEVSQLFDPCQTAIPPVSNSWPTRVEQRIYAELGKIKCLMRENRIRIAGITPAIIAGSPMQAKI